MTKTYPTLYKLDSKGKTRVWFMEQDGDKYRTRDGVDGGTVKTSSWRTAKPTNVGRSNERNGVAQATFEVEANYTKQLKGAYYEDVNDIHLGCRYFEPMLAEKYKAFEPGFAQPKLDGIRCVVTKDGAFSREGEVIPGAPHILEALAPIFAKRPDLILDGELYNHDLKDDFNELSSLIKKGSPDPERAAEIRAKVQYHIYDCPTVKKGFLDRSLFIEALIKAVGADCLVPVITAHVTAESDYDTFHGSWVAQGYEGSMWRCARTEYEVGRRSNSLRKRKDFDDDEFDIAAIEEGEGNWAGAAKRVVCWLPNADRTIDLNDKKAREKNTFEAGLRGTYDANQKLLADKDNQKVVSIRFFGWTPSAIPKPRFGVATKFHGAARTL